MVFWDAETWMYPGLLATRPELARPVVEYRYRTRETARANARKLGFRGLFYPWTSASSGDLWSECQSWNPPHCVTQNHLQGDVSLAVWQYYLATGNHEWLAGRGWPLLEGIADFWASRATANDDGSYSVKEVAGPDEYSNGVTDGVFTNAVAATALRNATRAAQLLGHTAPVEWKRVADGLRIPYDPARKLFLQYAGYNGSTIKQADTVLLIYPLEWPMEPGAAAATLDFYAAHTDPDGPAMTDSVHAIDAATIGEPGCATYTYLQRAVRPFTRGPYALFSEARGAKSGAQDPLSGFPAEDFLTGKGGFLQVFTHGLTGLRLREDGVRLDPMLPPQLGSGVTLTGLRHRGRTYDLAIGPRTTTVRLTSGAPFTVHSPARPPPAHRHAHAPHPPPGPRRDHRRGPLPPGDGDIGGPRPVRGGRGGRQSGHLLVPGRREGRADGGPGTCGRGDIGRAGVDGRAAVLVPAGDVGRRHALAAVPGGSGGPDGTAHGRVRGPAEARRRNGVEGRTAVTGRVCGASAAGAEPAAEAVVEAEQHTAHRRDDPRRPAGAEGPGEDDGRRVHAGQPPVEAGSRGRAPFHDSP